MFHFEAVLGDQQVIDIYKEDLKESKSHSQSITDDASQTLLNKIIERYEGGGAHTTFISRKKGRINFKDESGKELRITAKNILEGRLNGKRRYIYTQLQINDVPYLCLLFDMTDHKLENTPFCPKKRFNLQKYVESKKFQESITNQLKEIEKEKTLKSSTTASHDTASTSKTTSSYSEQNNLTSASLNYLQAFIPTEQQDKAINMNEPSICYGNGGTGKTAVTIQVMIREAIKGNNPVYIAPNPKLVKKVERKFKKAVNQLKTKIEIELRWEIEQTKDKSAKEKLGNELRESLKELNSLKARFYTDEEFKLTEEELKPKAEQRTLIREISKIRKPLLQYLKDNEITNITVDNLLSEFEIIIKEEDNYIKGGSRSKFNGKLKKELREKILAAYKQFGTKQDFREVNYLKAWLKDDLLRYLPEKIQDLDVIWEELRIIGGYDEQYYIKEIGVKQSNYGHENEALRAQLFECSKRLLKHLADNKLMYAPFADLTQEYSFLYIDEAQQLSLQQQKTYLQAAKNRNIRYNISHVQAMKDRMIYKDLYIQGLKKQYKIKKIDECRLKENFRSKPQVCELTNRFVEIRNQLSSDKLDDYYDIDESQAPGSRQFIQDNPVAQAQISKALAQSDKWAIVTLPEFVEEAMKKFATIDQAGNEVLCGNVFAVDEEIIGLEYKHVVLYNFLTIPEIKNHNDKDEEKFIKKQKERLVKANEILGKGGINSTKDKTEKVDPHFNKMITGSSRAEKTILVYEDYEKHHHKLSALHQAVVGKDPIRDTVDFTQISAKLSTADDYLKSAKKLVRNDYDAQAKGNYKKYLEKKHNKQIDDGFLETEYAAFKFSVLPKENDETTGSTLAESQETTAANQDAKVNSSVPAQTAKPKKKRKSPTAKMIECLAQFSAEKLNSILKGEAKDYLRQFFEYQITYGDANHTQSMFEHIANDESKWAIFLTFIQEKNIENGYLKNAPLFFPDDITKLSESIKNGLQAMFTKAKSAFNLINHGIIHAAENNLLQLAQYLLKHHKDEVDLNAIEDAGNSPLQLAVLKQCQPMVTLFLAHGADPSLKNQEGRTALDLAQAGSTDIVNELKNHISKKPAGRLKESIAPSNTKSKNSQKNPPANKKDPNKDSSKESELDPQTAMIGILENFNKEQLKELRKFNPDKLLEIFFESKMTYNKKQKSFYEHFSYDETKRQIFLDCIKEKEMQILFFPANLASKSKVIHKGIKKILHDANKETNMLNHVFDDAIKNKSIDLIKYLLDNFKPLININSSILRAVKTDHVITEILLVNKADPNTLADSGTSILSLAAEKGYTDIVKRLLANCLKLNVTENLWITN